MEPRGTALERPPLGPFGFGPRPVTCLTLVLALSNETRKEYKTHLRLVLEHGDQVGRRQTGRGAGRGAAHLWHGTDFVHLADEFTVGLKKQQQLEV